MRNFVKVQARLSEHNLVLSWEDFRKEFKEQTGINPTDSDILGSILYKFKDAKYNYLKRYHLLTGKEDKTNQELEELEMLAKICGWYSGLVASPGVNT